MDSIVPATALSVASLVSNLLGSVKTAKELAKQSSDPELKEQIAELFNSVLDVKERVLELDQENRQLRQALREKAAMNRDSSSGLWFKEGENDPLCPKCYEGADHAVVYLTPFRANDFTTYTRYCVVCKESYATKS